MACQKARPRVDLPIVIPRRPFVVGLISLPERVVIKAAQRLKMEIYYHFPRNIVQSK
jgi:hypothetical protein